METKTAGVSQSLLKAEFPGFSHCAMSPLETYGLFHGSTSGLSFIPSFPGCISNYLFGITPEVLPAFLLCGAKTWARFPLAAPPIHVPVNGSIQDVQRHLERPVQNNNVVLADQNCSGADSRHRSHLFQCSPWPPHHSTFAGNSLSLFSRIPHSYSFIPIPLLPLKSHPAVGQFPFCFCRTFRTPNLFPCPPYKIMYKPVDIHLSQSPALLFFFSLTLYNFLLSMLGCSQLELIMHTHKALCEVLKMRVLKLDLNPALLFMDISSPSKTQGP